MDEGSNTPKGEATDVHKWKHIAIAFACIIAGLLVSSAKFSGNLLGIELSKILEKLGLSFVLLGTYHVLSEFLLKKEFIRLIESAVAKPLTEVRASVTDIREDVAKASKISTECKKLGLEEIHLNTGSYDFHEFFRSRNDLIVVLGTAVVWLDSHSSELAERLRDPKRRTKIFLMHPHSPCVQALASKTERLESVVVDDILESVKRVQELSTISSKVRVFGHRSVAHHSLFVADRIAMSPYAFTRNESRLPLFIFSGEAYRAQIMADLEHLEQKSELLFSQPSWDEHVEVIPLTSARERLFPNNPPE